MTITLLEPSGSQNLTGSGPEGECSSRYIIGHDAAFAEIEARLYAAQGVSASNQRNTTDTQSLPSDYSPITGRLHYDKPKRFASRPRRSVPQLDAIRPLGGYRMRSVSGSKPYGTNGKCSGRCGEEAEYQIENGLKLCSSCTGEYFDRLKDNITLEGETCQWETLHRSTYNLYDGSHDWLDDLNKKDADCNHVACSRKQRPAVEMEVSA